MWEFTAPWTATKEGHLYGQLVQPYALYKNQPRPSFFFTLQRRSAGRFMPPPLYAHLIPPTRSTPKLQLFDWRTNANADERNTILSLTAKIKVERFSFLWGRWGDDSSPGSRFLWRLNCLKSDRWRIFLGSILVILGKIKSTTFVGKLTKPWSGLSGGIKRL